MTFCTEFEYHDNFYEGPNIEAKSWDEAENLALSCGLIVVGCNPYIVPFRHHTASGLPSMRVQ
jgi:hypothetical protein